MGARLKLKTAFRDVYPKITACTSCGWWSGNPARWIKKGPHGKKYCWQCDAVFVGVRKNDWPIGKINWDKLAC
jgi:hypothetical protein